jgi:2-oxoglutarate dehydrogenase E2 component (dihydrolipoamide succinyltransferase)
MIEVRVPDEQEGTKAVVRSWLKKVGDAVAENDPLVELETDKVTQEVPAPCAGVLAEIVLDTDAEAIPGAVLGKISTETSPVRAEPVDAPRLDVVTKEEGQSLDKLGANGGLESRLSPSVRRALQQHGIDPSRIKGTGRDGRITREDVDRAVAEAASVEPRGAG